MSIKRNGCPLYSVHSRYEKPRCLMNNMFCKYVPKKCNKLVNKHLKDGDVND